VAEVGVKGSGRPPKPTHLKILEGEREDRINRNEPQPSEGVIEPTAPLSPAAQKVWDRLVPDLVAKKVLTPWDLDQFVVFCNSVGIYHECHELMGSNYLDTGAAGGVIKSPYWQIMRDCQATMTQIGSRYGLTPSDRARLKIDAQEAPAGSAERLLS
jgi:P27 family predicted phage terminase small subunit